MGAVISLLRSIWALSYAAFSTTILVGTVAAFANISTKNRMANLALWLLSVQVSDLPFLGILSQILFYSFISITGTSGASTLATIFNYINFITIVAQLYLFKRSLEAKEVINKFLVKVSNNEHNQISLPGPDSIEFWKAALIPYVEPKDYTKFADIPYWSLKEQRSAIEADGWQSVLQMALDVYRPASVEGGDDRPVYVHIHGGGWTTGSKGMVGPLLPELISRNWVVVSIDFRINTKAGYPTQFLDCKRALRWVKDQIRIYGGDPTNIVVGGDSSGGHMAALLALTPNIPEYQPDFEDVDTTIQGCVPQSAILDPADINNNGPYGIRTRFVNEVSHREGPPESETNVAFMKEHSPLLRVKDAKIPFFVLHGDQDKLASVRTARTFVKDFPQSESHISYLEIPHGEHASSAFPSVMGMYLAKATAEWMDQNFGKKGTNGESKVGVHELVEWNW